MEEILSSIESLSREEFARVREWFYELDWERWDREIEEDSKSGKLDFLVKEALTEKADGKLKVGNFWSVRVGINHRALAVKEGQDFIWV